MYNVKLGRSGLPARHTILAGRGDGHSSSSSGGGTHGDLATRTVPVVPQILYHYLGRGPIVGIFPKPGILFTSLGKFRVSGVAGRVRQ